MEVGQGITTSTAMLIAEELELPVEKVRVTLADARPELLFNQLTGGSNTTMSTYTPIRVAAAVAKGALLEAAAIQLGDTVESLVARGGVVQAPDGRSLTYAALARAAASSTTRPVRVQLKDPAQFRVVGVGQSRIDARDAVTGRKQYATDLHVPGALPTMVCRAPTLNGTPRRLRNKRAILAMPGVRDVALVNTGSRSAPRLSDSASTRSGRWTSPGPTASSPGSPTTTSWRSSAVPSCRCPRSPTRRWRRPWRSTSCSTSAATRRWTPTPRSQTSAPTVPRSGPA